MDAQTSYTIMYWYCHTNLAGRTICPSQCKRNVHALGNVEKSLKAQILKFNETKKVKLTKFFFFCCEVKFFWLEME